MTQRLLHLSKDLHLPLDAATESFAILGRRGSGKTHTAVVMAEEMLKAGVQVVVIDPLDVWWGLRVSKDGKTAGFPIYVAGGSHADIPLSADAGKVLADAVVDQGLSIVLSTRHLSKTDQRRFVGDFCERLYDRKADPKHRTALHVDIDEADAFVPQRLMPGAERCFGAVDTLVRRGRSSGLAVTLISQRPQVINKDVLSQTEVLVSHQLTGPQDRKALLAWIEANDDENRSAEFMGALASLPKGRAWFWSPGLLKIFKPVNVRDRETFDSSATPKPGVVGVKPKAFAEVDLHKLTAEIAATIEKAKADDPRELRKEIARLSGEIAKVPGAAVITPKTVEKAVLTDADRALLEKLSGVLKEQEFVFGARKEAVVTGVALALAQVTERFTQQLCAALDTHVTAAARSIESKGFQKILGKLAAVEPQQNTHAPIATGSRTPPAASQGRRVAPTAATSRPASLPPSEGLTGPEQRIVDAIAEIQASFAIERPDAGMVAWLARYSPTSTSFTNPRGALRTKGLIDLGGDGTLWLTDAGRAIAHPAEHALTNADLHRRALDRLTGPERRILEPLLAAWPKDLSNEDAAAEAGYSPTSTSYTNPRGHLASLGLIEYPQAGHLRAAAILFPESSR